MRWPDICRYPHFRLPRAPCLVRFSRPGTPAWCPPRAATPDRAGARRVADCRAAPDRAGDPDPHTEPDGFSQRSARTSPQQNAVPAAGGRSSRRGLPRPGYPASAVGGLHPFSVNRIKAKVSPGMFQDVGHDRRRKRVPARGGQRIRVVREAGLLACHDAQTAGSQPAFDPLEHALYRQRQ